jgi:hypothetical protein
MTPERWEQIERIYHAASERAPEQRVPFLVQACSGDDELRREVESLLSSHDQVASFIEEPPEDVAAGMMTEERSRAMIGRVLGRYQLRSLLGAGGMGKSTVRETCAWTVTWPSKSCLSIWPKMQTPCTASSVRPRPWPRSRTRTSWRFTISAMSRA